VFSIERCAENGVSVFRIFDAMNDMRNLKTAVDQSVKHQKLHRPMIPLTNSQSYQVYQQSGAYHRYAFSLQIEIDVHLAKQAR
jgi:pyruvate/oxaloacetate carboxyltransferase